MKQNIAKRTLRYLKPYRGIFLIALLCMIIFGATDGVVPYMVKQVLDKVFKEENRHYLYLFPLVLIIVSFIRAATDFGQQYLTGKIGHFIVRDVRNEMNTHLLKQGPEFFVKNMSGDLLSRISSDVLSFRILLTDVVASIVRDIVRVIALVISAFYLDPVLSIIALAVLPIGVLPIISFGKKMRRLSRRGQDSIGLVTAKLNETILGSKVIKIFGMEEYEKKRFEEENSKLTMTFIKSEKVKALTGPVNEIIASLAISGVIFYGGTTVMNGTRSQGEFIAFLIAVFLLYDPIKKLSKMNSAVQQGMGAAERVFEFLDSETSITDPINPKSFNKSNQINLKNISFKYPGKEEYALKDISLQIEEGKKVAIVGLSGSGKTTLVDLISRFIDPLSGAVEIGGINVKEVSLKELRSRISMVAQNTFLFNDTVFNNIAYGREGATEEEVYRAAEQAFALGFIEKLPNKIHTHLGEGGFTLSGGERQRIAIARALLKDSPILILDEATAALDNHSEALVQEALKILEKNRTTIVIAHRLSTVVDADRIVVMNQGEIKEIGNHQELMAKNHGEYRALQR